MGYTIQESINNVHYEKKNIFFCTETIGRQSVYWLEESWHAWIISLYRYSLCERRAKDYFIFVFHVSCMFRTLHWQRSECTGDSHKALGMAMEMMGV